MYDIKEDIDNGDGTRTLVLGDLIEPTYGVDCLVCGKFIPCGPFKKPLQICDECKQAVAWAKEKMNE